MEEGSSEFGLPQAEEGPAHRCPTSWTDAPALRRFPLLGNHPRRLLSILTYRWIRVLEAKHSDVFSSVPSHLLFLSRCLLWLASKWQGSLYISQPGKVALPATGILTFLASYFSTVFSVKNGNLLTNSDWTVETGMYFENIYSTWTDC